MSYEKRRRGAEELERLGAEVMRLRGVISELVAQAERLDDAFLEADHVPAAVQAMVDAARAAR